MCGNCAGLDPKAHPLADALGQVGLGHDGIAPVDALRLVARQLHGH